MQERGLNYWTWYSSYGQTYNEAVIFYNKKWKLNLAKHKIEALGLMDPSPVMVNTSNKSISDSLLKENTDIGGWMAA